LIRVLEPAKNGFQRIVIWGSKETLEKLDDKSWLNKRMIPALNLNLFKRSFWQFNDLSTQAKKTGCDILYVPGGSYIGSFHPVVTMSRNLLPFEWKELSRFGFSKRALRYLALRYILKLSFKRSDGVIFLTRYAYERINRFTGPLRGSISIIPHGVNDRFFENPRPQSLIDTYTDDQPMRIIYVSNIDNYKHQWKVIEAVGNLRSKTGWPVSLDLVGDSTPSAYEYYLKSLSIHDPGNKWVKYHHTLRYEDLHEVYSRAHIGLFASSCENMPNILLETMAAGLPIVSSDRGPMPEILGDAGIYFDPENPVEIEQALRSLIEAPELRKSLSAKSYKRAKDLTWERCASDTFSFLGKILEVKRTSNRE
jgi:glycosyltransferase involved in cell wall biosynthesis